MKYILIPVLLSVATVAAVLATGLGSGGGSPESQVIVELQPAEDSSVLRQSRLGIVLIPGWDADLRVNGVAIPRDQLNRNLDLGEIMFQPGEGRAVETLPPGNNCISATYWQLATGPEQSFVRSWCFNAS